MLFERGATHDILGPDELREGLFEALGKLGNPRRVLAVPPDQTRGDSRAGELTGLVQEYFGDNLVDVLPALGTHRPMTSSEIARMFPRVPQGKFRVHRWREDARTLGTVPGEYVREQSEGAVDYEWPAQVNRLLVEGGHDLILSLGQVVPHEVTGMANHNKNLFVGTGGMEAIHRSHFLGAVYGIERILGRIDSPVRRVMDYAEEKFASNLPVVYVLTVIGPSPENGDVVRGLFVGDGVDCFRRAAELSLIVNLTVLDHPVSKAVVYLDPAKYCSTWLGNKAIYRARMALADDGELLVLAPGVDRFGEDLEIDRLIRAYGYAGRDRILEQTGEKAELSGNLCAAAHLIHGSSDGRFRVTYCAGGLTRREIEDVGFAYGDVRLMSSRHDPGKMADGPNVMPDGEEIFYISDPGMGLWTSRERFRD